MTSYKIFSEKIKGYAATSYKKLLRKPMGELSHPFIVPGACYTYQLWDWDSWLTDIAIRQIVADSGAECDEELILAERGSILNFLEHVEPDGRIPILIDGEGEPPFLKEAKNAHKPCLAQHLAFILKETGEDISWVEDKLDLLEKFIGWYRSTSKHTPTGLYCFIDDSAIGVDNDPSIFYRPERSTASVFLNSLMYRELLAMAYIMRLGGRTLRAEEYEREAEELKCAVNEHLYDEKCGMYYSADINLLPIDETKFLHSGMPRHWDSLIMRIDSWSGFTALWAGIAPPERAERVIKENMLNKNTFLGKYGVRSLSRLEKMYTVTKSSNPSCWLGPIWGVVEYFCFAALVQYGYIDKAKSFGKDFVRLIGSDIAAFGEMQEYYDPDTGVGVNNQGFQSWNLLVNNVLAFLENRHRITEF